MPSTTRRMITLIVAIGIIIYFLYYFKFLATSEPQNTLISKDKLQERESLVSKNELFEKEVIVSKEKLEERATTELEKEVAWNNYLNCTSQCPFGCHHDDTDCRVHCEWKCDRKWRPKDMPKADHIPDSFI